MSPLPAAEHERVRIETRRTRNRGRRSGRAALARAWTWIECFEADVRPEATPTGVLYTVKIVGFHPATAQILADAVDALHGNVKTFVESGAEQGPTGGSMKRVREAYARWVAKTEGGG